MLYIEPNSTIRILKHVNLDQTFNHTFYFANATAQRDYFISKTKGYSSINQSPSPYTLTAQSYARPNRGWFNVEIPADSLYDCNYMMFQNTNFGNKWFYAFIDAVEYVNNNVSAIHFTLDPMQTWFFDYTLVDCFVEREHSVTDEIGENLVPEPVNCGLYVTGGGHGTGLFDPSTYKILLIATCGLDSVVDNMLPPEGGYMAGVFQGVETRIFNNDAGGLSELKTFLVTFPIFGNPDNICSLNMVPASIIPPAAVMQSSAASIADVKQRLQRVKFNTDDTTNFTSIPIRRNSDNVFGGYKPHNNKLYTYPYNYFICTNQEGEQQEFSYEHFDPSVGIVFQLIPDYGVMPSVLCAPYGYKEKRSGAELTNWRQAVNNNTATANLNYAMYIRNFPRSAWATSDVIAKMVQATMSTAMIVGGVATGNPALAFQGISMSGAEKTIPNPEEPKTVKEGDSFRTAYLGTPITKNNRYHAKDWLVYKSDVAQQIANVIGSTVLETTIYPSPGQPNALFPVGGIDFIFRQVFLDRQYAEIIDNYFDMFGYQVNRIKVPNISSRPHWNYIKTKDFQLSGSVPAEYAKQICEIYDNGITFWKNGEEVGQYGLNNSPTTSLPTITTQPQSSTTAEGDNAVFTVAARSPDGSTLTYQWQVKGYGGSWESITGETGTTLTVEAEGYKFGNEYRCAVHNANGTVLSDSASLIVTNFAPVIRANPTNESVDENETATFSVVCIGTPQLSYQWSYRTSAVGAWTNVTSEMSEDYNKATLNISADHTMHGYEFRCTATNSYGSATSAGATLTVMSVPAIVTQPSDQTVAENLVATFHVEASGTPPLEYQWQWKSQYQDWRNSTTGGYNTDTLLVTATTARNGYKYRCIVTNDYGSITSNEATLTVT